MFRQNKLRKREEGEEEEKEDVEDTKDDHSDDKPDTKLPSDNLRPNGVKTEPSIEPEPTDRPATNGFKGEEAVKTEDQNGADGGNHENGCNGSVNANLSDFEHIPLASPVDMCGRPPLDETAV